MNFSTLEHVWISKHKMSPDIHNHQSIEKEIVRSIGKESGSFTPEIFVVMFAESGCRRRWRSKPGKRDHESHWFWDHVPWEKSESRTPRSTFWDRCRCGNIQRRRKQSQRRYNCNFHVAGTNISRPRYVCVSVCLCVCFKGRTAAGYCIFWLLLFVPSCDVPALAGARPTVHVSCIWWLWYMYICDSIPVQETDHQTQAPLLTLTRCAVTYTQPRVSS